MGAVETVVGEVRELIRRPGVDPLKDERTIRQLVRTRSRTTTSAPCTAGCRRSATCGGAAKSVLDAVAGFGPLQPYLDDPTVEEIWINEPSQVFVARARRARADHDDPRPPTRCATSSSGC